MSWGDLVGIEPTTFPASRDALSRVRELIISSLISSSMEHGTMRFPALDLSFPATRLGERWEVFLMGERPGPTAAGRSSLPTVVLDQSGRRIVCTADIEPFRGLTSQDVNAGHKGGLVDLVGIEPTTSSMPWKRAPSCATGP